jgi:hypothetical protein
MLMDCRIDVMKMAVLPKSVYMFNAIPNKLPMAFITETEKSTLKFTWKHKRWGIAKAVQSKNSNAGGIIATNFKLHCRVTARKSARYWHKNRHEDQWSRTEDPDMNPCRYAHLIFNWGAQNI